MRSLLAFFVLLALDAVIGQDFECPRPNGYFADPIQCDRFIECKNDVAQVQSCPDGLLVNEQAAAFRFPCDYPVEVDCGTRRLPPVPLRSAGAVVNNCQRRWGMFRVGNEANCGQFVNCVDGVEYIFNCPEGLAWHPTFWRCEWPDSVPTCDSEAFLGFKCPAINTESVFGDPRYAHPKDCARFFICVDGGTKPRLQVCGGRTVFNQAIGTCDDPANVPGCENYYPPEENVTVAV